MLTKTRQGNTTQQDKAMQHTSPKAGIIYMYLTTFFPLQPVQSLADHYACRVKKGGSIPEVKDGEMRETSSELEEASFVLQADALQVRSDVHMYMYMYVSFVLQDGLNPLSSKAYTHTGNSKKGDIYTLCNSGRGNLNGYSLERREIPAQIQ